MIWQYFSLSHWRVFRRVVGELVTLPVCLVLDLEDSVGDPLGDPVQNAVEKTRAREALLDIVTEGTPGFPLDRLGVRINGIDTPYYQDDIIAIRRIQSHFRKGINVVLPKVEYPETLDRVREDLGYFVGSKVTLCPIVESTKGVRNLDSIVSNLNRDESTIQLGIMDLQLDQQRFPFIEPDSDEFTNFFSSHLISVRKQGIRALVGPIFHFRGPRVIRMMANLEASLGFAPDYLSLTTSQSRALLKLDTEATNDDITYPIDALELARFVVAVYETNAKPGKRVVVYRKNRLISPHEYIMAKRYLTDAAKDPV